MIGWTSDLLVVDDGEALYQAYGPGHHYQSLPGALCFEVYCCICFQMRSLPFLVFWNTGLCTVCLSWYNRLQGCVYQRACGMVRPAINPGILHLTYSAALSLSRCSNPRKRERFETISTLLTKLHQPSLELECCMQQEEVLGM